MDDEQTETMRKVFAMFDQKKTGFVEISKFPSILKQLGSTVGKEELQNKLKEVDIGETGKVDFDVFCQIVVPFMEEEDTEAMREELKEAFRMYDKDGAGYITPDVLKEILKELDSKLSAEDLDDIVEEVDTDGSGTVDFDEFMEMMTG